MSDLSLARLAKLGELASSDPLFNEYGRRYMGDLSIQCGDQQASFTIQGGRVVGVSLAANPHASIQLQGDEANWRAVWGGMNGGLHRAWRHRMIGFDGDPQAVYGYWKMIWRLGDLMVAAGWGD